MGWGPVSLIVPAKTGSASPSAPSTSVIASGGPRPALRQPESASGPAPDPLSTLDVPLGARGRLDPSTFVMLGDDLAAGMGELSLSEDSQRRSFPAVLARHMGVPFKQPLFEPPGVSGPIGLPPISVRPPRLFQTTVLREFPPVGVPDNLSVPGFSVADAVQLRPAPPLVQDDIRQTSANLILGLPALMTDRKPPTQLEAALQQRPSFVIVALGLSDVLRHVFGPGIDGTSSANEISRNFEQIFAKLVGQAIEVVAATIPDPLDTAWFSTIEGARRLLRVNSAFLSRTYDLTPDDRITPLGLFEIAGQIQKRTFNKLRPEHFLKAETARGICELASTFNENLQGRASRHGVGVFDLAALYRKVHREGVSVGGTRIAGDYLGGFYTLNGLYPGWTGHALIARELLAFLNDRFGATFPPIDLAEVLAADPVAHYARTDDAEWSWESLAARSAHAAAPCKPTAAAQPPMPSRRSPVARSTDVAVPAQPLQLPPDLVQVLPLNESLSYHGDGMRVVNCLEAPDAEYGLCGNALFGGLALFGSHLKGSISIRFTPPSNNVSQFTVNFVDGGLAGEDSVLATPQLFRFPILQARVSEWPGTPACSGSVNLATGEVTNIECACVYSNSGLAAIAAMNPGFPKQPIRFPGTYGTAWAAFKQRPDGMLDFNFQGSTFIPLGQIIPPSQPFRFPLPFGGTSGKFASVPAHGTALHPHLHLSTEPAVARRPAKEVPIPTNTTQENVVCTKQSSFGDVFTLHATELGVAHGRSHVQGRIQVQYGERFGDAVAVHVALLPPAGLFENPSLEPLQSVFPARLSRGLLGHNEFLQFPLRTYYLDNVYLLEDPLDLALGAVDVRSGDVIGDIVHRGFIGQDTFFALVRVEPRTPQASFQFRGPALFHLGPSEQLVYHFSGQLTIPYPAGFLFPATDLATGVVVGPESRLDPFMEIVAVHADKYPRAPKSGRAQDVMSSIGARFSYEYDISQDVKYPARFRYRNDTKDAEFVLREGGLTAVTFHRSTTSYSSPDTVTFSGFGTWAFGNERSLQLATMQVSTAPGSPYVSIQVGGNLVSNVNTKLPTTSEPLSQALKVS
jgi:hypothetical protein